MKYLMRKKMNKKGFSLIELIIVIAILAIIAAIAIPRFVIIQARSEVKSDAATASEIVNAARIFVSDNPLEDPDLVVLADLHPNYIPEASNDPQSVDEVGVVFVLDYDVASAAFYVTWTPDNGYDATIAEQWVVENIPYLLDVQFTF